MIVSLDVIRGAARRGHSTGASSVSESGNNDEGIIAMTITGASARRLPLIGQAVGQAQASLARFLTGILAESGEGNR
jgi:hypothetical protein